MNTSLGGFQNRREKIERLATGPAQRTLWHDATRSFAKNKLAMAGLVFVLLMVICAVFAPLLAPWPYYKSDLSITLQFPNATHLLGTDDVGRDMLSRVIYGIAHRSSSPSWCSSSPSP